ncbi:MULTISPECIES: peptidylprolyl isomerase [Halocynthiibacter]|uniref:Peptidyl-prolyl cis-trans isomerase n=1 Tax=Halocynthiibacter halioticoli TaxID=2986804 RepID=A0AAE3IXT8_9RHOB|nr:MULTISPECIES: peptidylprolyl isomerase [Halocynthiibacter]MCV6824110.1 peptidylprolyl isomerase [Halocynthiibacter halioticoli]MCW4057111.1 peptidylprolyl isomerase [Halocynthiibacter sp. SDUM655004]
MRSDTLIISALSIVGAGVLGGWMFMNSAAQAQSTPMEDGPGPNLVIEVGGETEGTIVIDLRPDLAPNHVERFTTLANDGAYDNVVFHRVIDGFMAQTGDVQFGKTGGDTRRAGMGGSELPDVKAEFSDADFQRGIVGVARSQNPDSANSQFFIMFAPAPHLNGQYTVVGHVVEGMDVVDAIKKGDGPNGAVSDPDFMKSVTVVE